MKIAIIGGGFTGLTAAYFLARNNKVTVFEKEEELGGLASGFKAKDWQWSLEKSYHHFFSNDSDVLSFAKEIGFKDIFFKSPTTASLYGSRIFPLDTPKDLLMFPLLSFFNRLRVGAVLAFLKLSPFFSFFEEQTSEKFLRRTMGEEGWKVLWQELFRKKFGKSAGNILASFIWTRVKKRTKRLGYVEGGVSALISYIAQQNKALGVNIKRGYPVSEIKNTRQGFRIGDEIFDIVIATVASPILAKIGDKIFPKKYLVSLKNIKYSASLTAILEVDELPFPGKYWLNIASGKIPFMVFVQHTDFIDKKKYGNRHLVYFGDYLDQDNKLLKKSNKEIVDYYLLHFKNISKKKLKIFNSYVFKQNFAQPIFDKSFVKTKPQFQSPVRNFYVANLEMTYPYDRGINYAVAIGRKIARIVNSGSSDKV